MKNKGNQKHLTFEQRVDIEKGLTENKSFAEIGRIIGKNPSTISKEVRLHAHTKERPDSGYTCLLYTSYSQADPDVLPGWKLRCCPLSSFHR